MITNFKFLLTAGAVILLAAGCSYSPLFDSSDISENVKIIEGRSTIEITTDQAENSAVGLLFYPGGLVDSHVYDQLLSQFTAENNIKTVVVKEPSNLAVLDIEAGIDVIKDYPEITRWVLAGHSLGGSMAAATIYSNPDVFEGLIFMDSYPADSNSLKDWNGVVLSLFSSIEKISDDDRMQQTLDLIPPATWLTDESRVYPSAESNYSVIHQINGGSHSYFGTYGPQDGDYTPTITREEFHTEVLDYMNEFFTENSWS